ncbi:MAG: hypothetical protein WBB69_08420 [Anaerolineales bacterium]|jgi:hypothetical protein
MDGKTICNHCTGMIPEGEGSLFYSSASLFHDATKETGNIFLCEKCTDLICSPEGFAKEFSDDQKIASPDLYVDTTAVSTKMKNANHRSIVASCKRKKLSPAKARKIAHKLAVLWWKNPLKAESESEKAWK